MLLPKQVLGCPELLRLRTCRVCDEEGYASEDTFYVTAEERISLKMYNKNVPYVTSRVCFEPERCS